MRSIVVGVDTTERSEIALRHAAEEARLRSAKLIVLYALAIPGPTAAFPVVPDRQRRSREHEEQLDRARERLSLWIDGLDLDISDLDVETMVVQGSAARALIDRSRTADLVVVGSRSRTRLGRLRLVSVSEQVARGATCSVLVARPPAPG